MGKRILLLVVLLMSIILSQAQNTPEDLGERIFDLFKNESYNFRELLPSEDQIINLVESKNPELVKNRLDEFQKEYPNLVKRFNKKCQDVLEAGVAIGIVWQEIELTSVKPYMKTIGITYGNSSAKVEITKLYVNFSCGQREFSLIFDAVVEYDGQFLVSNDAIVVEEVTK
jgi:hypothetical protein